MGQVKELNDIQIFLTDVICLIIDEVRAHPGETKTIVLDILKGLIEEKIRNEGVAAFTGLSNIGEEAKNAGVEGWLQFAIEALGNIVPRVIDSITKEIPKV